MLTQSSIYKEYLDLMDTEAWKEYIKLKIYKIQQIFRPRIISDASTSEKLPKYCRFRNVRENLIFANIRKFGASRIHSSRQYSKHLFLYSYFSQLNTHLRIQEIANYSEMKNSRNKGHTKISESTVF